MRAELLHPPEKGPGPERSEDYDRPYAPLPLHESPTEPDTLAADPWARPLIVSIDVSDLLSLRSLTLLPPFSMAFDEWLSRCPLPAAFFNCKSVAAGHEP